MEYVIVGDTSEFKDCLVLICGRTLEDAQTALEGMINNPENNRRLIRDHTNLRIKEVKDRDCWWNFNCG